MIRPFCSLVILALFIGIGCASKEESVAPDLEAPLLDIYSPAPGDTVGIDSLVVLFQAVDDIGITKVDLSIDHGPTAATVFTAPWKAVLPIAAYDNGPHSLTVSAFDAVGNVTAKTVPFVKGLKHEEEIPRIVLVEIVTSANCIPCAPANETYKQATDNEFYRARLATIKYHAWFPRSTDSLWRQSQTWARPRIEYLFSPIPIANASAPNAWVDGTAVGSSATNWVSALQSRLSVPPELGIDLSKRDSAGGCVLDISVKPLTAIGTADLRLHTVITENDISYNDGNAETMHYDVMRCMIPNAEGEQISLTPGKTERFTRFIIFAPFWVREKCSAVVFVQDHSTKQVLQAAKIALH
ncbi:MAG: Omp28-related outer membrane protein [Bacteroidota bacterium]|nr:Omp28-related outer membrane protein [Bacteroidota bacterium]